MKAEASETVEHGSQDCLARRGPVYDRPTLARLLREVARGLRAQGENTDAYYVSQAAEVLSAEIHPTDRLMAALDESFVALRGIDAADQKEPIPDKQLDEVSFAIATIEETYAVLREQGFNIQAIARGSDTWRTAQGIARRSITKSDSQS